jgi:molecular chaperone DnaK
VEEVAGLTWDRLDEVILVGGQTLMPAVRRAVAELCGRPPRALDRPQLAVALGAGEYARILSLGRECFHQNALVNVIALRLGIRLEDNTFEELVPANATVPHSSRPFPITTVADNQTAIRVEVLQGPRGARSADECVVLGGIDMEVPPAPAGTPKLEVQLEVRSDGTLKVVVTDTRRDRSETLDLFETRILAWRDQPPTAGRCGPANEARATEGTPTEGSTDA